MLFRSCAVDELSDGSSESDAPPGLLFTLFFIFLMCRIPCKDVGSAKSVQRVEDDRNLGWTANAEGTEEFLMGFDSGVRSQVKPPKAW